MYSEMTTSQIFQAIKFSPWKWEVSMYPSLRMNTEFQTGNANIGLVYTIYFFCLLLIVTQDNQSVCRSSCEYFSKCQLKGALAFTNP